MYKALALGLLIAGPASATGIEIEVAGTVRGVITIDLLEEVAPNHVERITTLAEQGAYNGIAFHRVIEGFMAQTGDVQYGDVTGSLRNVGFGGSDLPDLNAELTDEIGFEYGIVGMGRGLDLNTANSQFFLTYGDASHLDGDYTVVGRITAGFEVFDAIKKGEGFNGAVIGPPDYMREVRVID